MRRTSMRPGSTVGRIITLWSIVGLALAWPASGVTAQDPGTGVSPVTTTAPSLQIVALLTVPDPLAPEGQFTIAVSGGSSLQQRTVDVPGGGVNTAEFLLEGSVSGEAVQPVPPATLTLSHDPEWEIASQRCSDGGGNADTSEGAARWFPGSREMRIDPTRLTPTERSPESQESTGRFTDDSRFLLCQFDLRFKHKQAQLKVITVPAGTEGALRLAYRDRTNAKSESFEASDQGSFEIVATVYPGQGAGSVEADPQWQVEDASCVETYPATPSQAIASAGTAVYGIDPLEDVLCLFLMRDQTAPREGRWQIVEAKPKVRCDVKGVKLERSKPEKGTLTLAQGGNRLNWEGSGRGPVRTLDRVTGQAGRYLGKARVPIAGGTATAKLNWQVLTPEGMVGTSTVKAKVQGKRCTFIRNFRMRRLGD